MVVRNCLRSWVTDIIKHSSILLRLFRCKRSFVERQGRRVEHQWRRVVRRTSNGEGWCAASQMEKGVAPHHLTTWRRELPSGEEQQTQPVSIDRLAERRFRRSSYWRPAGLTLRPPPAPAQML